MGKGYDERMQDLLNSSREIRVRGKSILQYVPNKRLEYTAAHFEEIEPEMLDWIDSMQSSDVFYDLGASNGMFSVYAAIAAGVQVVAFEPEAQNYATLEVNAFLNQKYIQHPIIALNVAVSDHVGLGRIYCDRYGAGNHNKILDEPRYRDAGVSFTPEYVQAVIKQPLDLLVDSLGLAPPTHIKIDVDGSELPVLKGGVTTLSDHYLRSVFIELFDSADEAESITDLLASYGFDLVARQPVHHPSGGYYDGLFNCIFERP